MFCFLFDHMFSVSISKKDSKILTSIQTVLFEREHKYYYKKQIIRMGLQQMENDDKFKQKVEECLKNYTNSERERIALWIDEEMKLKILKLRDKYDVSQTKLISCIIQTLYDCFRVSSMNTLPS